MTNLTRWNSVNEFEDLMNRYNRMFGLARSGGEREGKDVFSRSDWAVMPDPAISKMLPSDMVLLLS